MTFWTCSSVAVCSITMTMVLLLSPLVSGRRSSAARRSRRRLSSMMRSKTRRTARASRGPGFSRITRSRIVGLALGRVDAAGPGRRLTRPISTAQAERLFSRRMSWSSIASMRRRHSSISSRDRASVALSRALQPSHLPDVARRDAPRGSARGRFPPPRRPPPRRRPPPARASRCRSPGPPGSSVSALSRATSGPRVRGERALLAGDARAAHRVDEAPRRLGHAPQAGVGARGRREEDGVEAAAAGDLEPLIRFLGRQVGHQDPVGPRRPAPRATTRSRP